ncbi:Wzz/FepE/Etk N-terminal domain-containing protein [Meiothermus cerbereus]|uniref:Wzz/FepE/Etk N-terminal domain-containing protein n=1 Tax=Meiothermus cerbereus TaxID=65552 RepID=UPI003EE92E1B
MSEATSSSDEISLRDLYLILKRRSRLIVGVTLGLALLTLAFSLLWPKTYTSQVVVSLSLANQSNQGLLNNLPSLPGLAQGFVDLQQTKLLANQLGVDDPTRFYKARFDEKRGLLFLTAEGGTAAEANERAERILEVARKYLERNLLEGAQANLRAALAQTRLDLQAAQDALKSIQAQLAQAPDKVVSNPTVAAALEARGNDPQTARATNPAYTSLSLDESRLRSQIAQLEARINTLNDLLMQPQSTSQLVNQTLLVQVLVPPAEPLRPSFPRPALFTVVAGVLGLLMGVLWAFIAEAVRSPDSEGGSP